MPANRFLPVFLLLILALIWGSSFILIKIGNEAFTYDQVATLRMAISMVCTLPFAIIYLGKTSKRDLYYIIITAIIGNGIPAFLFPLAETVLPSAVAGVLNSLAPLFVLITGRYIFNVHLPLFKIIGILIGFGGAAMMTLSSSGEENLTMNLALIYGGIIVFAAFLYGLSTNMIAYKLRHLPPGQITSLCFFFIGIPSAIWLFAGTDFTHVISHHPSGTKSLLAVTVLSAVGSAFALILFYRLMSIKGPASASTVTYLMPIVALGWGLINGEKLNYFHFVGFALILTGVFLVNKKMKPDAL